MNQRDIWSQNTKDMIICSWKFECIIVLSLNVSYAVQYWRWIVSIKWIQGWEVASTTPQVTMRRCFFVFVMPAVLVVGTCDVIELFELLEKVGRNPWRCTCCHFAPVRPISISVSCASQTTASARHHSRLHHHFCCQMQAFSFSRAPSRPTRQSSAGQFVFELKATTTPCSPLRSF